MIQPRLAEVLQEKGLTLYWLAQETEIAYSTLHKFARARTQSVDYRVFDEICSALGCHPGDILIRVANGQVRAKKPKKKGVK
jgi:DNA-binding Xre family transcriptional regulator